MLNMQVIGHIGQDAVIKTVNNDSVINFSIGTTKRWKDKSGTNHEATTWVECSMWNRNNIAEFLKKGTLIYAEGEPNVNAFVNKQNETKGSLRLSVFKIELLSSKKEKAEQNNNNNNSSSVDDGLPF